MAGKYGTPYFANFVNSDMDISDVRSMCPLRGDTLIDIRESPESETKTVELRTILDKEVYVPYRNKWKKARGNKSEEQKVIKICAGNNTYYLGEYHLQPVVRANTITTVSAKDIVIGDYLLYACDTFEGYPEDFHAKNYASWNLRGEKITEVEILGTSDDLYCVEVCEESIPGAGEDSRWFELHDGLITHNCRLQLNLKELRRRNGGLFGAGDSTGSIGVVTINLPRLAYEAKGSEEKFFEGLAKYLEIAKESLEIKREWLQKNVLDTHLIPAYIEYVGTINNHFSTIGVVGMNEMCENLLGKDIRATESRNFCVKVGEFIRNTLVRFQEETGHLFNYEATPAESTCYRLALKDKKDYPDIITQGSGKDVYYTNSCHIPVKYIKSINDTFAHQDVLQTQFTGGTVIHCYLEGAIPGEHAKQIVKSMFYKYRVPYMSLSPISRYCDEHGYIAEHVEECPYCKKRLKMFQRITGYLRCIDNFNRGKAAEFKDRVQLGDESDMMEMPEE